MTYTHSNNLKRIREKSGMTPEKLVSLIQDEGVSLTFRVYDKMEREGYLPKKDGNLFLEKLSKHLGCKVDEIKIEVDSAA